MNPNTGEIRQVHDEAEFAELAARWGVKPIRISASETRRLAGVVPLDRVDALRTIRAAKPHNNTRRRKIAKASARRNRDRP
jgi:hypothetical protein